MGTEDTICEFLRQSGWVEHVRLDNISFLAAGEYNENYLVQSGREKYVFRINHGSQLGLVDQIEYEFRILETLQRSGVTPRPLQCRLAPGGKELGDGVLLMEYLPGRPLDYDRDTDEAARVFARVHAQPASEGLLVQRNPVRDIAEESLGLITRYEHDHPMEAKRSILLNYHETVLGWGGEAEALFAEEPMVVVNTEVNSHNFIMDDAQGGKKGYLVDWEKAVVSCRYQDLGHFLVPTTTLWKTKKRYTAQEKEFFLAAYRLYSGLDRSLEEMVYKTTLLEKTILLRAMAWCFMACYEYTRGERALRNEATFRKILQYLDGLECFLK